MMLGLLGRILRHADPPAKRELIEITDRHCFTYFQIHGYHVDFANGGGSLLPKIGDRLEQSDWSVTRVTTNTELGTAIVTYRPPPLCITPEISKRRWAPFPA